MSGHLPFVSIITPSYNQGSYIRETIESVLQQNYPHIEHIVVDGGSTDETLDILREYEQSDGRLRYVSEPDRGQSHAINKGLWMAKGSIIGWLNSDDTYLPGAIAKAVEALQSNPEWALVYGRAYYTNESSQIINFYPVEPYSPERLYETNPICQPAAFFRKSAADSVGGVDEELYFCMDYDLWIRMAKRFPMGDIEDFLANARLHPASKNVVAWSDIGFPEVFRTSLKHYGSISNYWLLEYIGGQIGNSASWLLQQLKAQSISGPSPYIAEMNRYEDLWVPPHFRCVVRSEPANRLHTLLLRGRNGMNDALEGSGLSLSIRLNGKTVLDGYCVHPGPFLLEIPIHCDGECAVDIVSDSSFVPAEFGMNDDERQLSFLIEEIVPLSAREYDFFGLIRHFY